MDAFRVKDYERAIQGFKAELAHDPSNMVASGALGTCLFALGLYSEAIPFMSKEGDHERARIKGSPGMDLLLSVAYWCAEQPNIAMNLMSKLVSDVSRRKVTYANDTVGGVVYGLYLYYYATIWGDAELVQKTRPYMHGLNEKQIGRIGFNSCPLPSARQVLGIAPFEEVLLAYFDVSSVSEAKAVLGTSLVARNNLCEALFWDGVLSRVSGDTARFRERMIEVRELQTNKESPIYHLAHFDLAKQKP